MSSISNEGISHSHLSHVIAMCFRACDAGFRQRQRAFPTSPAACPLTSLSVAFGPSHNRPTYYCTLYCTRLSAEMSAEAPAIRRSGRARKAVSSYADEQAEETVEPQAAAKRKRAPPTEDDEASSEPEPVAERPRKKAKKPTKPDMDSDSQTVKRLVTTEKRPPGERRPPQVWDVPKIPRKPKDPKASSLAAILADSFEECYQQQVSRIPRLNPGQQETRLKAYVLVHATTSLHSKIRREYYHGEHC